MESQSAINHPPPLSFSLYPFHLRERKFPRKFTRKILQEKCPNQTRGFANPETVLCHPKPSTATRSWTSISISTRPGPWTRSPSVPTLCPPSSSPAPSSPALLSGPSPTMPRTSLPPSAPAAVFVSRNVLGFSHVSFGLSSLSIQLFCVSICCIWI